MSFDNRYRSDLSLLEAAVTRAGEALACGYSSADEYEAEIISTRRAAGAFDRRYVRKFRLTLGITALVCLAALFALTL
jgi:hypothetical protein